MRRKKQEEDKKYGSIAKKMHAKKQIHFRCNGKHQRIKLNIFCFQDFEESGHGEPISQLRQHGSENRLKNRPCCDASISAHLWTEVLRSGESKFWVLKTALQFVYEIHALDAGTTEKINFTCSYSRIEWQEKVVFISN